MKNGEKCHVKVNSVLQSTCRLQCQYDLKEELSYTGHLHDLIQMLDDNNHMPEEIKNFILRIEM